MFRNYLKVAFRNLKKNKGFSAINIFGLAIGLATCLLISLYITNELSYDRYNEKAERIYRVHSDIKFGGGDLHLTVSSDPMGATLKKDYPQVEQYTRIYNSGGAKLVKKGNEFISEMNVAHVDSTFFDVFSLPAIVGNLKTALNEPNTVVITEAAAKKYLGSTDVVGKTIEANSTPYKITAVIKNVPSNSHFRFDFFFSMDNVEYGWGNYLSHNFHTYIVLKDGTDYKSFERNFARFIQSYIIPQAKQFMQIDNIADFERSGNKLQYSLMPLTDIHLKSDRFPELSPSGNIQYVYIFGAVALFVLLIACINFVNLSTARSAARAKEVGVRKVLGSQKKTLVLQFLVESIVTVLISLLIAIAIAASVLHLFNDLSAKSLTIGGLFKSSLLPFIIALPIVIGAAAGIYPAIFLSRFKPVIVLKGSSQNGFKKSNLRSALVVVQFATSVILIIGTVVVYSQLTYIQNKQLGYNKEQVLIVQGAHALENNTDAFKNDVLSMPGVTGATYSSFLPVSSARNDITLSKTPVMDAANGMNMQRWTVDYDYISTLGMQVVKGRNFSRDFGTDSLALVINETTANLLGYADPVGKKMYSFDDTNNPVAYEIIGVVKNFHFESMHQTIGPLCMGLGKSTGNVCFKVNTGNIRGLLSNIEARWKALAPGMPFGYQFLNDSFDQMYRNEERVGKVAISFTTLAILIACLGLFGLVTYSTEQRVKEIGIRKVLGASVTNIVAMLSKDFLMLVMISLVIASPVAWWFMNRWLQDFAYRTNISWWVFAIAAVAAVLIALITISFQSIKAALINPVKNLRSE